jgi:acyl carrier protein phosphodiesterase
VNFLAHLFLSKDDPEIMVGNFIGDFVRGRNLESVYTKKIALGIELHREIDAYTDKHEIVMESKKRLRPKYRHYSPVIVDVFYDHFLAAGWPAFHPQLLTDFAANAYSTINLHEPILPQRVTYMLPYMTKGNWLVNYAHVEGINRALTGMSQRTPYESKMNEATLDLEKHYNDFQKEFNDFFPQLKKFCDDWLNNKFQSI